MHSNKKLIIVIIFIFFSSFFLSGCTLQNLFGSSISLISWNVCDDDGFPSVEISFSNTCNVNLKTEYSSGTVIDSDEFFYGEHNVKLNIDDYRNSCKNEIFLKAYDNDGNDIFSKTLSFDGLELKINSCEQKWWKRQSWGYSLIGIVLSVTNNGDVPAYPYYIDVKIDSNSLNGYILPNVILPGETKNIKSFIYCEDNPISDTLDVTIKDIENIVLSSDTFDINYEDLVDVKKFNWKYDGMSLSLSVPYPDFLHEYYQNLDRIILKDYSFYVFDKYDDDYLDFFSDQLQYTSSSQSESDKINFAAAFIQNLEYRSDVGEFDYPNYPLETLFSTDGGCDCEDMSILTANILDKMGYEVALFRLTNHMAVGIKLVSEITGYDTYEDGYYFLETTSKNHKVGYIPNSYKSKPDLEVFPISNRPLLYHDWYDGNITKFINTEIGNVVKAKSVVFNLGRTISSNANYEGVFYDDNNYEYKDTVTMDSLKPGMKKKVYVIIEIPSDVETKFKTRVYDDDYLYNNVESNAIFP